ncbi:MAG: hypothetical protein V4495_11905 [Pseudomonadota bacterium]
MEFDTIAPKPQGVAADAPFQSGNEQAAASSSTAPLDLPLLSKQEIAALHPRQFHNPQLGLEFYAPGSWREVKNARSIHLQDSLTDARLEANGFARANVAIEQWAAMRLPILQKEMPYLQQSASPRPIQGDNWAQRIQGIVAEYRGRASGDDEDTCVLICCMRTDELLLSITITAKASAFDASRRVYQWMLSRSDICHALLTMGADSVVRSSTSSAGHADMRNSLSGSAGAAMNNMLSKVGSNIGNSGSTVSDDDKEIGYIASGQRLLILGIVLSLFVSSWLKTFKSPDRSDILILLFLYLLMASTGLFGFFRMAKGFAWTGWNKLLMFVLACIPVVSFFTFIYMNFMANRRLKEEGYKVGLLGAPDAVPEDNHDFRHLLVFSVVMSMLAYGLILSQDKGPKEGPLTAFSPPAHQYSVVLPGTPKEQTSADGNGFNNTQSYILLAGKIYYGITSFDLYSAPTNVPEVLNKIRDRVAQNKDIHIVDEMQINPAKYPGRSLRVESKGLEGRINYYVAGKTVYIVQALGPAKSEKDARKIKSFLESFYLN